MGTQTLPVRSFLAVLVGCLAAFLLAAPGSSIAQTNAQETSTATSSETSTTPTTGTADPNEQLDEAASAEDDGDTSPGVAVGALAFGLLAIAASLAYLYLIQERFYDAAEQAMLLLKSTPIAAPVGLLARLSGMELLVAEEDSGLEIHGPATIPVGPEGAEFSVLGAAEGEEVSWTISPETAATVKPERGSKVKVTAAKAGNFTVNAQRGTSKAPPVSVTAVDVAPQDKGLPFVGTGWGALVISITLITGAVVLGVMDVLEGEAIATLFGALAGYVFLKGTDSGSGGAGSPKTPEESKPDQP